METTQTSTIASKDSRSALAQDRHHVDAGPLRHGNRRGRAVPANQRRCWRYDPADHHGYPCVPDDIFLLTAV